MKITMLLIALVMFAGCKTTNSDGDEVDILPVSGLIWNSSSERVFIVKIADGLELGSSDIVYDYSRDTLPAAAKTALFNLVTTTESLTCPSDGSYFTITITENTGIDKVYFSDNAACDQMGIDGYIKYEDIDALLLLLL